MRTYSTVARAFKVLCLLSLLLRADARPQVTRPALAPTGTVSGRVLDFDARKRELIFEGEGVRRAAKVGDDGNYEIDLPAGIYHVIAREPAEGDAEILPDNVFRRASFRVRPNAKVVINISSLRNRVYCTRFGKVLQVIINDLPAKIEEPRPKYDTLWLPGYSGEPRDVVVEYCGKKVSGAETLYTNATITHDRLTVTAPRLGLNKKTFYVRAGGGEVIIEDGFRMKEAKEFRVSLLTNGSPHREKPSRRRKRAARR